jgi:diaminopimelate epimerase
MTMYNADGSQAEMCGNGLRCVAKYVYDHGIARKEHLKLETGAGILEVSVSVSNGVVDQVTVDMGEPGLASQQIPTTIASGAEPVVASEQSFAGVDLSVTTVSMGNPHCITFVEKATDDLVLNLGPKIETDARFPERTNVEFVEVLSPTHLRQRTWERGSGETWACGTGASAVCVAGVLCGVSEREVTIDLLGGSLRLRWDESTNHVFMTGPAVEVFSGTWPVA